MIRNKKASVSIITIYIVLLSLFLMILSKSLLLEHIYYYKNINKKYDLFMIENALISNVYSDFNKVEYHSKDLNYYSNIKFENNDYIYEIDLRVYEDNYKYLIRYDKICNRVLEFNEVSIDLSS